MNIRKQVLYIVIVILTVLAVDMLFLHIVFPAKKQRFLKELNQEVETSLEEHPPVSPSLKNRPQLKMARNTDLDFKSASEACLGSAWGSYQSFPDELKKTYKIQTQVVDIENYHLKLSSGEERRIHVVSDGSSHKTVRLFGLDAEGLPTPIPLSNELRSKPVDDVIRTLKAQGQVFFQQTKERWLLGNGNTLLVTFENGQPNEFQLFGSDKTLSCLKDSCQCL